MHVSWHFYHGQYGGLWPAMEKFILVKAVDFSFKLWFVFSIFALHICVLVTVVSMAWLVLNFTEKCKNDLLKNTRGLLYWKIEVEFSLDFVCNLIMKQNRLEILQLFMLGINKLNTQYIVNVELAILFFASG